MKHTMDNFEVNERPVAATVAPQRALRTADSVRNYLGKGREKDLHVQVSR